MITTGNQQKNCIFFLSSEHIWFGIWPLWSDDKNPCFSTCFFKSEWHKNFFDLSLRFYQVLSFFYYLILSLFQRLVYETFFFSSFWKGELVFCEFFCYKIYSVCDLIDLVSNVSIIRRLSIIDRTNWLKYQFHRWLFSICNHIFGIITLPV